jgi:hypothetical protein
MQELLTYGYARIFDSFWLKTTMKTSNLSVGLVDYSVMSIEGLIYLWLYVHILKYI